jgi:magnesium transporter
MTAVDEEVVTVEDAQPRTPHRPIFQRRTGPGAEPGSLVVDPHAPPSRIQLITYSPEELDIQDAAPTDVLPEAIAGPRVAWVRVIGLGSSDILQELKDIFDLHRLTIEDVVNVHQRPKIETYRKHIFATMRKPDVSDPRRTEQVGLFLGEGYVLTFEERESAVFDPVLHRLHESRGRIRRVGADYLMYALIDTLVDLYFPVLEVQGERLDALEDRVLTGGGESAVLLRLQQARNTLRSLRREVWAQREALSLLNRDRVPFLTEDTRVYLRDTYDHSLQLLELIETFRELSADLIGLHMSMVNNRMSQTMQVLTVIATIFIPLTFVVGIYGMNFDTQSPWNMPELQWQYGYVACWAIMIIIAAGLAVYFRRRGWLGGGDE